MPRPRTKDGEACIRFAEPIPLLAEAALLPFTGQPGRKELQHNDPAQYNRGCCPPFPDPVRVKSLGC